MAAARVDPPRATNYPRNVCATFKLAIEAVVERCATAEALMDFLAMCAPERIPLTRVEVAITDEAERTAAEEDGNTPPGERDTLFREAAEVVIQHQHGSTSLLQRRL